MKISAVFFILLASLGVRADLVDTANYDCVSKVDAKRWQSADISRMANIKNGMVVTLNPPNAPHYFVVTCDESQALACFGHSTADYKDVTVTAKLVASADNKQLELSLQSADLGLDDDLACNRAP